MVWVGRIMPTTTKNRTKVSVTRRFTGIQYLRAAASLSVVLFHAIDRAGLWFGAAAAGVDVFFVLSGLVIWLSISQASTTPASFAARRLIRIVPLYWAVTLVLAITALILPALFARLHLSFFGFLHSLFFIPYRNANGQVLPLLAPGWTLNYEIFFYVLVALVLFLPRRLRLSGLFSVIGALLAIGLMLGGRNPILREVTNPLLLEFAGGVGLAHLWQRGHLSGASLGCGAIALAITGLAVIASLGVPVNRYRVLLWGIPAILLVAGVVMIETAGKLPSWPAFALLGDASYSIYLIHPLLISAVAKLWPRLPLLMVPIDLALALPVGIASFLLFEKPVTNCLRALIDSTVSLSNPGAGRHGQSTARQTQKAPTFV